MNFGLMEASVKASYREHSDQYRRDDERELATEQHRRLRTRLETITASFGRPIEVLDAGCGTGRYFHCLQQVDRLVGVDLSPEMLAAARNPVRAHEVTVRQVQLVCESIFEVSFAAESFDFIYSLGMFGLACPVTAELCGRFHEWLRPGGLLLFDVPDRAGQPLAWRARRRARKIVYPFLPARIKRAVDERQNRLPMFDYSRRELEHLVRSTPFRQFTVTQASESPLWKRPRLECLALKAR